MQSTEFDRSRWVSLGEIESSGELSCIDGRHDGCIVGAPGGNVGEFILLMSAAERLTGQQFKRHEIEEWLAKMADKFGRFYMHTDQHAIENLYRQADQDPLLTCWIKEAEQDLDGFFMQLQSLDPGLQKRVSRLLLMPDNIGCGHLRLLLENAPEYMTRRGLVEDVITGFFHLLWGGNTRMYYVMLKGEHQEEGVVTIDTTAEITANTVIPYSCNHNSKKNFVNHKVARDYFMRQSCITMAEIEDFHIDANELFTEANRLAEKQMTMTLDKLAKDLPQFRLVV